MTTKDFNRREFFWGLSQTVLTSFVLGRAFQQVAAAESKPTSVLVLGAGLSGLYTALLLEAKGLAVTVIEARNRVGGRVYTLDDIPGKPEAGGQALNENYQRLLALAENLQVSTQPTINSGQGTLLYVRGQPVLPPNWAASPANLLAVAEGNTLPPQLLSSYLSPDNPLPDDTAWTRAEYFDFDIPLKQYLSTKGASSEALRLMNFNPTSFFNSVEATSALWALRNNQRAKTLGKQPMRIEGGNSRLPEKMAAALKFPVQTRKVVKSMRSSDSRVEVECADGSRFQADYAIVTLPFSVLRRIKITPQLQGVQAEAVAELPYTIVTRVQLAVRRPFWKEDGFPPQMWTDTPLQSIYTVEDETGMQNLACITGGASAQQLDSMNSQVLAEFVRAELARIRPASRGNVEIASVVSWGRDPFARGAYSHFAPGQIRRFRGKMAQPWQRIHFAGEHTAIASPSMESALESAERVASEILTRIE
ncbi:FAD-dependent oxidoreductase [Chroococcidiopsis sp. FACHB-1243]|uniref:flavin monoamine oxidase family protein n=1 Tax=Chroococcidiopsis sp. [FACHB-1243] TaxID=2692781 RepID=UPI00177AC223|nr:NAD(P)/FAD-dependent oxidoreductase [Chroococcidiopsis sp. [FACHB-1243]]MBD2309678.1 FAD-dependent oxidoreductase [Chroococcidiopsis sp. [FACHB-1243]]